MAENNPVVLAEGELEQVQFYHGLKAKFDAAVQLGTIDENAMYVLTDAQRVYKGQTLVGANNVKIVDTMPAANEAFPNVIYVVETAEGTTLAILNKAGTEMVTLINTAELQTWTDQVKLSETIAVNLAGDNVGGVIDKATLESGITLTTLLKKMFIKEVQPTITAPKLTLAIAGGGTVECGTAVTPTLTPTFTKGSYQFGPTDTGVAVTQYTLTQKVGSAAADTVVDATTTEAYTAPAALTVPEGTIVYNASAVHSAGVDALTNTGAVAANKINAGTKTASQTITGQRNMFYVADDGTIAPANSAEVRALANKKLNPANGTNLDIAIPQGCRRVIIAYPKKLREVTSIVQASTNMSAKGSFVETTISVEGANAYQAIDYRLYTYISGAPLNADTFKVTI